MNDRYEGEKIKCRGSQGELIAEKGRENKFMREGGSELKEGGRDLTSEGRV